MTQAPANWADADGRGYHFDSSTVFTLPDGSMRMPDSSWVEAKRWDAMTEADSNLGAGNRSGGGVWLVMARVWQ